MSPDQRGRRLFADDYSSTGQKEWKHGLRGADERFWRKDFLGQLRFDSLTSEKLVVPDSHIFDGLFFALGSPHDLLRDVARPGVDAASARMPLEIRARRGTLADSLAALLRRPDSDFLNHFVFKTIEDDALRDGVAGVLGRTPAADLDSALETTADPANAVMVVLRNCLDRLDAGDRADEVLGPLEAGWRRWLELDTRELVAPWPDRRIALEPALRAEALPEGQLLTQVGHEALEAAKRRVRHGSSYRGDISRDLGELKALALNDEAALQDVDLVERWYSRGRYRAIAWQHDAMCAQIQRPWMQPLTVLEALYREALNRPRSDHTDVPEGVISALGDVDAETFAGLTTNHHRDLHRWWHDGDLKAMQRIADALAELPRQDPARRNPIGISEVVGAVGPAGGAIAGAFVAGPVGAVAGAVIGVVARLTASRLRTPTEHDRMRDRIVEAWTYRAKQ